jgi:hypothetical protein
VSVWTRHRYASAFIAGLACTGMSVLPTVVQVALADELVQEAAKGQSTGANHVLRFQPPTVNNAPPPANSADYFDGSGNLRNEVYLRELFPGADPDDPAQLDSLSSMGSNPTALTTQGIARQTTLQNGTDETSRAYQATKDGSNNPHHAVTDMRAESFLNASRDIIAGESPLLDTILASCDDEVTTTAGPDRVVRLEDVQSCSQAPVAPASNCSVTRSFSLQEVERKTVLTVKAVSGAATGAEHWTEFYSAPISDPGFCRDSYVQSLKPPPSHPFNVGITEFYNAGTVFEPEIGVRLIYSNAYCGTHASRTPADIEPACRAASDALLNYCRNYMAVGPYTGFEVQGVPYANCTTGSSFPLDWSSCPDGRQQACEAIAGEMYSACTGAGNVVPMTGAATFTQSALPAAENRTAVAMLGTSVDVTETPFDLATHGLAAGGYVIANHAVLGQGVTASVVTDEGRNGTNWDYTFEVTTADSSEFTVDATLYRIVENAFVYSPCTAGQIADIAGGVCPGSITCTDLAGPCRDVNGVQVCNGSGAAELLSPWANATVDPMCWAADVRVQECQTSYDCVASGGCVSDCGFLPPEQQAACEADLCWTALDGTVQCLDSTSVTWVNNLGEPGYVDDCADLLRNTECRLLAERPCVEGMEDPADPSRCLLREVRFDCGRDRTLAGLTAVDETTRCAGQIRCFGDECANTEAEQNPDFMRAATAGSAITEATKNVSCNIAGDPNSCRVFDGEHSHCRDPRGVTLGLIPDCCKMGRDGGRQVGDFTQYMQLARYSYELAQKPMVASYLSQSSVGTAINQVIGPGSPVTKAIGSVGKSISDGFSSALKWAGFNPVEAANSGSSIASSVATSPTAFGPIQQFIATGVKNFLQDIGLDQFANQLFTTTAEGTVTGWASSGLGQMIGSVISVIGTIYLIYSILKILGSIFFKCKDSELNFGVKVVNRMCHYVGKYCSTRKRIGPIRVCVIETQSYCCFASPLARIMNEQIRAQGVIGAWGTAQRPNCAGIAIGDLAAVNWDAVDLSEWEAILLEAGLVPDPRNPPLNFVPTNAHPGNSSGGSADGVDSVTLNRQAITTAQPTMDEGRFLLKTEPVTQQDPELMPWYGP